MAKHQVKEQTNGCGQNLCLWLKTEKGMHAKETKENNVGKIKVVLGWALPQCLRIPFKKSEQL